MMKDRVGWPEFNADAWICLKIEIHIDAYLDLEKTLYLNSEMHLEFAFAFVFTVNIFAGGLKKCMTKNKI